MANAIGRSSVAEALEKLASILEREKARGRTTWEMSSDTAAALAKLPFQFAEVAAGRKAPEKPSPETAVSIPSRQPEAEKSVPTGNSPKDEQAIRNRLNEIYREAKNCEVCKALGTLRNTMVFACGNPMADLMFVGEAPGAEEEKEKKPFVGPAGQKLTQIIKAMGFDRDDVYITNIVKWRPKKEDGRFQGASNRKPTSVEMEASIRFVRAEIDAVKPKAIVALGATAAEGLLERGGTISSLRGTLHEFAGVPVVVTYHPSFLLRQESEPDPEKAKMSKRKVWEDMLRAMEIVGLEITDKQRNFFR